MSVWWRTKAGKVDCYLARRLGSRFLIFHCGTGRPLPRHQARYIWLLLLVTALFLQSRVSIFGVRPELLSALVFIYGMRTRDDLKATLFGAFAGIVEDSLSNFWGPNILSKALAGYLSANILGGFFVWSPLLGITGIFFITALEGLLGLLVSAIKDAPVPVSTWVIYTLFMQSLINAPLGLLAGEDKFSLHDKKVRSF